MTASVRKRFIRQRLEAARRAAWVAPVYIKMKDFTKHRRRKARLTWFPRRPRGGSANITSRNG